MIHFNEGMKECPFCGCEEFYIKQSYRGTCNFKMRFDMGEDIDNSSMYSNAQHRDTSKYAYCNGCGKRLFPIEEYYQIYHNY